MMGTFLGVCSFRERAPKFKVREGAMGVTKFVLIRENRGMGEVGVSGLETGSTFLLNNGLEGVKLKDKLTGGALISSRN